MASEQAVIVPPTPVSFASPPAAVLPADPYYDELTDDAIDAFINAQHALDLQVEAAPPPPQPLTLGKRFTSKQADPVPAPEVFALESSDDDIAVDVVVDRIAWSASTVAKTTKPKQSNRQKKNSNKRN